MELVSGFLQIFFAVLLVIGFLLIGFSIYNFEMLASIRSSQSVQITTPIFKGVVDFHTPYNAVYNTINNNNPLDATYRNLGNATNQPAGAEFSYNFWLYIDPTGGDSKNSASGLFIEEPTKLSTNVYQTDFGLDTDQFILFVRGAGEPSSDPNSIKPVTYNRICSKSETRDTTTSLTKSDIMIKCPLVKLENKGDVLTVEFNTIQKPDAVLQNARNTCNDTSTDWNYMNSYKIGIKNLKATYPAQWFMVTLVIMDTYPSDPVSIRNKVRCKIFINGAVQLDQYVDGMINPPNNASDSTLLQNQGNLYVGPQIAFTNPQLKRPSQNTLNTVPFPKSLCMAELTFMNYVPTTQQISTLYDSGFTQAYAPPPSQAGTNNSGQLASQNAFMTNISVNKEPSAVSQIYTVS